MYYEIFGSLYFFGAASQIFFLLTTEPKSRRGITLISCDSGSVAQESIKKHLRVIEI